ncbi:hypothetical protein B296_00006150 [Ensete ventricosum]|uniref:Uncharacterized protein n=1 Tax=Ensete ventricosum TaxID=4639 RepID=A0A427AR15_ENSVE|nr:hypothetical protein B296_00006150 [Ensete ventricosum]
MFCRSHDFSKSRFDDRTVMICDQESFDPIIEATTGRDLIPSMVYGYDINSCHLLYQQEFYVFWEVRLQNYRWLQQAGNTKGR